MQWKSFGSAYVLDDLRSIVAKVAYPRWNTYPCLEKNRYGLFAAAALRIATDRKLVSKSFSEGLNDFRGRLSDAKQINSFIKPPEFHGSVIANHLVVARH
jgi:hypothetical protein